MSFKSAGISSANDDTLNPSMQTRARHTLLFRYKMVRRVFVVQSPASLRNKLPKRGELVSGNVDLQAPRSGIFPDSLIHFNCWLWSTAPDRRPAPLIGSSLRALNVKSNCLLSPTVHLHCSLHPGVLSRRDWDCWLPCYYLPP